MSSLGLSVGFGLITASILAIASVGLTLQFGVTNYVNFAYGDFMSLGGYLSWKFNTALDLNIWVAMVCGAVCMGFVGVLIDRFILSPFTRRFSNLFYVLIVTFGLSLVLLSLIQAIFTPNFQQLNIAPENPLHLGPFLLTPSQVAIFGIGVVAMIAVHFLLTRTRLGKAMRAMSDNTSLAMVSGIDTRMVTTVTWFITGCLAGLAGTVLAINLGSITPAFGETYLFVIFAAVILGGIGKPYGAMAGALVMGLATEVSASFINSAYKLDVAFAILVIVLLVRPQGIVAAAGKA
ncbi:MAG: branched-chain amino acid ABC transporter permease [Acidimicrobiales bacterium]